MSLVSKAKQFNVVRVQNTSEASVDMVELAVAYAKHEVTLKQVAYALFPEEMDQSIDDSAETNKIAMRAGGKVNHALISAVRTGKLVAGK